jgi:hypothetical protein
MTRKHTAVSLLRYAIAYCDDRIAILRRQFAILRRQRRQLLNDAKREGVVLPRRGVRAKR